MDRPHESQRPRGPGQRTAVARRRLGAVGAQRGLPARRFGRALGEHAIGIAELLINDGRRQGLQQGREEGQQSGLKEGRRSALSETLCSQLERRFGALDDTARTRIADASEESLQQLIGAIFDLESLNEAMAQL